MGNTLFMPPGASLLDGNGDPLNGGLVYFYEAGTSTAKDTYPTENDAVAQTNANANPVVLNSAGRAQIWLRNQYKVIVKDSSGNTIQTVDEVGSTDSSNAFQASHIDGLTLTIDSGDTSHDINIAAGEARDGADSNDIELSSAITKQIDASWAVGDDAGGMDTGSVANDTIYYIWLIKRTDTGVVDALISTSNSSPTMPTNYDKKRLIGVAKTDGSANLERVSSVNRPWDQSAAIWPDSGSANAYAITPIPSLAAYSSGLFFSFLAENANTGTSTINISGLGTITIQLNGRILSGGEIAAGAIVHGVVRNVSGTNTFQIFTDHRSQALIAGYINGLTLSAAGSTGTFGIAAGAAADGTGAVIMKLASAYTKTTSSWAVGTGNGALDTGSIANTTGYHVWLIMRSDTGVVDVLFSTSATAPTMPASYDYKRRIGWMRTDGSAQWRKFVQVNNTFMWDVPIADHNGNSPTSATAIPLTVPSGLSVEAIIKGTWRNGTNTNKLIIYSPLIANPTLGGVAGNIDVSIIGVGNDPNAFWRQIFTDTSTNIKAIADDASTLMIATQGWIDPRGQW